jgi:DNA polymerase III delta prime subunit
MSNALGLMIESLVAVLLVLTIGYSIVLNKRLKRLKADEMALKATISELITATEIAERAIGGLKVTVRDCDQTLGERLRNAERLSAEMARQLVAGEDVLDRVNRLVAAGRAHVASDPPVPVIAADAQATVKAAQAFAARARHRTHGVAA